MNEYDEALVEQAKAEWNAEADAYNQWDALDFNERIAVILPLTRATDAARVAGEVGELVKELQGWANCGFQDEDYHVALNLFKKAADMLERLATQPTQQPGEGAHPIIEAIATWERENGTVEAIRPSEYKDFIKEIKKASKLRPSRS